MNQRWKLLLFGFLLCGGLNQAAFAATEIVEIYFLPLQEAADAAKSQLSNDGKVAAMPSRHILLIDDDQAHINKATALLKRLDHAPGQYTAYLNIENITSATLNTSSVSSTHTPSQLAGGWSRVRLQRRTQSVGNHQSFQLRVSGNQPGSIEAGVIQSLSRETRLWLSGYGIVQANSVELVPITSGFNITVRPAGSDQVRVRITPWMKRAVTQIEGQQELLIGLGTARNPATPPSSATNMRLNAQPVLQDTPIIEIAGAATELVIPVDQSVTIAASNQEAEKFAAALLSRFSSVGKRQLVIHLRVSKN